jgi:predicted amidohydrolase YtcJ
MKNILFAAVLFLMLIGCSKQKTADVIYKNGKIYTVNENQPWAEAVAIKDGKFIKVGNNAEVESLAGKNTEVVDLRGQFVMPGIVDMHAHPFTGVDMGIGSINLSDPGNPDKNLEDIKTFIKENPERDVYLGGNWYVGGIYKNDSPDKKILDEISPDVPIFLLSQSGHSAWVNSKALELAGVDENYQNKGSYIFDRYEGTNEPSGTARDMAMVKIMNALHYLSPEEFAPFLKTELERYSKYGVTAIQPGEGSPSWLLGAALLEKDNNLNVRLFPALDWLTSQLRVLDDDESKAFIDDWKTYETDLIKPHYVKIFGDGGADSHTILMKEPFADSPGDLGSMFLPIEDYRKAILDYHSKGISVHVHVLGDGTAARIIDIFEEAEATYPESKANLHLSHNQSTDPEDLDRLVALKTATVSFSPMLAVGHPQMDLFIKKPLGEERHQRVFPVKAAIEKGLQVGFGSDFPSSLVPDPDSFFYMQGWVTRQFPGTDEYGTINIGQAVSVEQAIKGFTLGGAQALGNDYDKEFGSIEEGKSADMIVLSKNLLEIPKNEIHKTKVKQTIFRGRVVFDRAEAINKLHVVDLEIANEILDNAVDAADLNLLIEDDFGGGHYCFAIDVEVDPGARSAPDKINKAFTSLSDKGYRFLRPARTVFWKADNSTYWIQWTVKDDVAVLWAYDPVTDKVVEALRVREK